MTKELENIGKTWGEAELGLTTESGGELWRKPYASTGAKLSKYEIADQYF